ncbi:hypothetical protein [Polyangium sp. 15x6]|uniref:hypothetical protein n=1 Tax=Polyangium sp. 15x6 TaxID=3042687 RepID=UPI00249AA540|nr:hypothetical protein [Polyangium sp. 15x6]MDI3288018.1 hypothetical protein [Polyangium sp. 15x6]
MATEAGLDRFRRRNLSWKAEPRIEDGAALVTDSNGEVWVVSWLAPSITRASDGTAIRNAPPSLLGGLSDHDGSIWIYKDGTFLHWLDGRFVPVPPPDEVVKRGYTFSVMAAAKDRAGRLWASVNGIGQFYRKDDQWTFVPVLPEPDRLDWTASKVHADAADRVWLAYRDELAMVDQGKARVFKKADGPGRRADPLDCEPRSRRVGGRRERTCVPARRPLPRGADVSRDRPRRDRRYRHHAGWPLVGRRERHRAHSRRRGPPAPCRSHAPRALRAVRPGERFAGGAARRPPRLDCGS